MKLGRFITRLARKFSAIPYKIREEFKHSQSEIIGPFVWLPSSIQAKWILDVGANEGLVSLAALKSYPDSKVICFEPVKETFLKLQKNLSRFKERTFWFNMALSDLAGQADIKITNYSPANCFEPPSEFYKSMNPTIEIIGTQTVVVCRLDDICREFPSQSIDILKIDVEGHELNVLSGGENFISSHVDTIIIEISFQRDQDWENQLFLEIFVKLKDLGFRLINIFDVYNSTGLNKIAHNMLVTQIDCVFRHKRHLTATPKIQN